MCLSVCLSIPLAQPQPSDSARAALISPKGPQISLLARGHTTAEPISLSTVPSPSRKPRSPSPVPLRWIISERMDRASSEVLSVAQEAARLRKDRLSSSKDAQDCGDTVGSAHPGCEDGAALAPARPLPRRAEN